MIPTVEYVCFNKSHIKFVELVSFIIEKSPETHFSNELLVRNIAVKFTLFPTDSWRATCNKGLLKPAPGRHVWKANKHGRLKSNFNANFVNAPNFWVHLNTKCSVSKLQSVSVKVASWVVWWHEQMDSSPRESYPSLPSILRDVEAAEQRTCGGAMPLAASRSALYQQYEVAGATLCDVQADLSSRFSPFLFH